MIKSFTAAGLFLMVSIVASAQDGINVRMTVPSIVEAGREFPVSIAVDKGRLEEFSRFQQELPEGLTAVQDNSGTADYSFDNQRVRFIWLKLPPDPSINLTYKVRVNERLKGTFTLGGEFSYVEGNERKSVSLAEEVINITPSPDVLAEDQIDIASFASVMAAERAAMSSAADVTCIRQTPYLSRTGNDFFVNLLVYKKDLNKYAKIEETIPPGFEARSMESREGLFTFRDGIAKFVWMNLPEIPGFIITYRLVPTGGQTLEGPDIRGILSYIVEGRNMEVEIQQMDIDLSAVTDQDVEAIVAAIEAGEAVPAPQPPLSVTGENQPAPAAGTGETSMPAEREAEPATVVSASSRIPSSQLLAVQDGLYFRVQLAATHRFRDANITYAAYNLSRPVKVEMVEGWYKYTAGSFGSYQQARDFRNSVTARGIDGAFIVAYRNGRRIAITDALPAAEGN